MYARVRLFNYFYIVIYPNIKQFVKD
jgi:hypothetical protein